MTTFVQELANRMLSGAAPVVVGLDPRPAALPADLEPNSPDPDRFVAFYRAALPVLARHIPVVKPNIAFFECYGHTGFKAYETVCGLARDAGLLVIGDIKRGDIGSTAEAYAQGHFDWADAVTLHPYLGSDSLDPFLRRCAPDAGGKGVFVLVRTSNPGAKELQDLTLASSDAVGEQKVCDAVARAVDLLGQDLPRYEGYSPVGAVVGATWPGELERLRALLPSAWILLPGVGAQGGRIEDLRAAFDERGLGALVNQSRGIMQVFDPADADWLQKVETAAADFAASCRTVAQSAAKA
ncbi:MAG: orotidine-5'-phosphate decarboxylase [Planctomycetota bacterium]|nr:orotidine-5'-phosphate decarboxylase [Planctomycetota bacterium]